MKGVILAGGSGTRLHPLTRITNKHLLPIYDRPMVNYAIEALVKAGITELMLVTGGTHAGEFLRLLGNGHEYGIDRLSYAYQERAGGIAEALGLAERFVGGERVCVMLADNVVEGSLRPAVENFEGQERGARILLAPEESPEHLRHLGVPELDGTAVSTGSSRSRTTRRSNYAVTGIYFYDSDVFDVIPTLEPSGRGELEITDVNNHYVRAGDDGVRRDRGVLGRRGRVDRRLLRGQRLRARERRQQGVRLLEGMLRLPLRRFDDERGWFMELMRTSALPKPVRQSNLVYSRQGVIRCAALPRARAGRPLRMRPRHGARGRARPRHGRHLLRGHRRRQPRRDLRPGHIRRTATRR